MQVQRIRHVVIEKRDERKLTREMKAASWKGHALLVKFMLVTLHNDMPSAATYLIRVMEGRECLTSTTKIRH